MAIKNDNTKLLSLMVLACAFTVGNIYYSQPLLGRIADDFSVLPGKAGSIPTLTQVGYMVSLFFLAPLGDFLNKRLLLLWLLLGECLALLLCAGSSQFWLLQVGSFAVGVMAVTAQILIPAVAEMSSDENRGRNLGWILSASLVGILASRLISGWIGAHFQWRWSFFAAAVTMLLLWWLLKILWPKTSQGQTSISRNEYHRLIASLLTVLRSSPELFRIALVGAACYAAFTGFWASLAFLLQSPPLNLGPDAAGAFGFVGIAGALASNFSGRKVREWGAVKLTWIFGGLALLGYFVLGISARGLAGLVLGVVLLDAGAQGVSLCNQNEIYRLYQDALSRRNTLFKIFYFLGGAAGSACSTLAWQYFGWWGVCGMGSFWLGLAGLAQLNVLRYRRQHFR